MVIFYDSGVGGLSYLEEYRKRNPHMQTAYVCDNAFFPYGEKPADVIVNRAFVVIDAVCRLLRPNLIVLACNTLSVVALKQLRSRIPIPIIGVVPAVKLASAQVTNDVPVKSIVVLATNNTAQDTYTKRLITEFISVHTVHLIGLPYVIGVMEKRVCDSNEIIAEAAEKEIREVLPNQTDIIVLACTHFVRLRSELMRRFAVPVVDSLNGVVSRIESVAVTIGHSPSVSPPKMLHTKQMLSEQSCLQERYQCVFLSV